MGRMRDLHKRAGAPKSPGPLPARLTGNRCYWTVNFQDLGWLPAVVEFWSSALSAGSFAPVVTVALVGRPRAEVARRVEGRLPGRCGVADQRP